jgi:Fe-S oxidoreductase
MGPRPSWSDPETIATLDLCLSCKACKSECPSNVDVARLKAEYTAQSYRSAKPPLQSRVFGNIHALSKLAAIAPPLTNLANTIARPVLNAALGLHPKRSLPPFKKPLHKQWGSATTNADAPTLVLYADTFTTYNEPEIGLAAKRLLEAFGYRIELFRGTDAARAMISVGLLDAATNAIDAELPRLAAEIDRTAARAVLFIEPSVLSSIADDWLLLKTRAPKQQKEELARRAALVEHFLDQHWDDHPTRPTFTPPRGRIALHAHCHQKALWGPNSSAALLRRAFEGKVDTLDTTCCGMAGSFGYTRDRYDLSMRIGELSVLPAVREARSNGLMVAPGTSCRHQIKDGAGDACVAPGGGARGGDRVKQDRVRQPLLFAFCAVMVWAFVAFALFGPTDTQRHYRAVPVIIDLTRSPSGAVADASVRTAAFLERGRASRGPTYLDDWWLEVATTPATPDDQYAIVAVVTFAERASYFRFEPTGTRYAWCALLKGRTLVWDDQEFAAVMQPAVIDVIVESLAAQGFELSETLVEETRRDATEQGEEAYLPRLFAGIAGGDIAVPAIGGPAATHIAISIIGFVIAAIAGGVYGWYACPQPPDPNARSRFI